MTGAQFGHETWRYVIIGAGDQPKRNAFLVEDLLQISGGLPQLRPGIVVETRKNMRGAGYDRDPIRHKSFGHLNGDRKVGGAIVKTRQNVAMQVEHDCS